MSPSWRSMVVFMLELHVAVSFTTASNSQAAALLLSGRSGALSLAPRRSSGCECWWLNARSLCRMSGGGHDEAKKSVEEEQEVPPATVEEAAASWDQYADEWDGMAGPESLWAQDSAKQIDALFPGGASGLAGKSVLEFGCGTGVIGLGLAQRGGCRVLLADIAPKMVENARKKAAAMPAEIAARVDAVAGDVLEEAEKAKGPFDLIVSGSVLTFLPDARGALNSLAKRMSAGGMMIHFVWKRPASKPLREGSHHFWDGFTAAELEAALQEAEAGGLQDVKVVDFNFRMGPDQAMDMLIGVGFAPAK